MCNVKKHTVRFMSQQAQKTYLLVHIIKEIQPFFAFSLCVLEVRGGESENPSLLAGEMNVVVFSLGCV